MKPQRYKRVSDVVPTPVRHAVEVLLDDLLVEPDAPAPPPDWILGSLLNVRCTGPDYAVTLFPEEYDPRKPERTLRFTNSALCQGFVSAWYSRTYHDPRA